MAESYSVKAVLSAVDSGFTSTFSKAQSMTSSLAQTIKGTIVGAAAFKAVGAAANALSSNVGNAISRFDTLNQYPKILQQMGYSADDAKSSIQKLSDGIQGVPTALDEIAGNAKSLILMNGNVEKGTKLALAMNNAFLASGSSSSDASRGMIQFTQMLSRGKVGMQEWNTLNETMKYGLTQTAKKLGIASGSTTELYDALQDGTISMDQFQDAIIECSEETGGFAELAKTSSQGIATSMTNLKTAITKGMADSITAIETFLSSNGMPTIAESFDSAKEKIAEAFKVINEKITEFGNTKAFQTVKQYAQMFFNTCQQLAPSVVTILNSIGTAIWNIVSDAETMSTIKSILQNIAKAAKTAADFMSKHGDAVQQVVEFVLGAVVAFKALKTAMAIKSVITGLIGAFTPMAASAASAGSAVGTTGAQFAKSALGFLAVGAAVLLASTGLYLLAQAAIQIASAGTPAMAVMAGMVVVLAGLAYGASLLAPALTTGAVGLVAFGAAIALVGAGAAVAGAGAIVLGAGLVVVGAGAVVAAAGITLMGAGVLVLAAGVLVLAAGLTACVLPLTLMGASGLIVAAALLAMSVAGIAMTASCVAMLAGLVAASAGIAAFALAGTAASVGFLALSASLSGVKKKMSSIADSTSTVSALMKRLNPLILLGVQLFS